MLLQSKSNFREKRKGIVCCVAVVQHIAKKHLDNNSEISSAPSIPSVENSQDLPQHGKCKDAASMIDSMFMLISGYPDLEVKFLFLCIFITSCIF